MVQKEGSFHGSFPAYRTSELGRLLEPPPPGAGREGAEEVGGRHDLVMAAQENLGKCDRVGLNLAKKQSP